MMRRPIKKITSLIIGVVAMICAGNASALTVTATGTPGAGTTTFTFTGSSIVTSDSGNFQSYDDVGDEPKAWFGLGPFLANTALGNRAFAASASSASVAINGASESIFGLYMDADTSNANATEYYWGIYLPTGVTGSTFTVGDVVSWTGNLVIDVDFSTFVSGVYTSSIMTGDGFSFPMLDMTLAVNDPAEVPLPAAAPLFIAGLASTYGLYRRKRKAISSLC